MKKICYMPLEIKNRDFYSRLLISLEICDKNNYDIYFGYRGEVNYFAKNYFPGIYFGLTTLRNFDHLYLSLKSNGNIILILDEEGLVTYSSKFYKKFKVSKKILEISDLIFTWGKKNTNVLKKIVKNKKKIVNSGNTRLDLLKKPFSGVYKSEINKIKKKYGNFYLLATNFSYTNYFDKKTSYFQLLKGRDFFKSKSDLIEWKNYEKVKSLIYEEIINFIKISKKLKIVIRCHPSENYEIYKKLEKNYNNVYFDNSYSLHPWILASKGIISHYCTSTFEALVADKKAFTLKPIYKTELEDNLYFKTTINAKNNIDLFNKINNSNIKNKNKNVVKYYSENFRNNFFSHEKISEEIEKLNIKNITQKKPKFFLTKYKFIKLREKLKSLILLRSNKYVEHKIQNISKEEIQFFINFFPKFKNKFNIEKISKNFFLISKIL